MPYLERLVFVPAPEPTTDCNGRWKLSSGRLFVHLERSGNGQGLVRSALALCNLALRLKILDMVSYYCTASI